MNKQHENKIWKRFVEITSVITGFFALGISLYMLANNYIRITEIPVGIGPFLTSSREDLELEYLGMFRNANDHLRENNSNIRFYPAVEKGDCYTDIFQSLANNKNGVKIASISRTLYLAYKAGKLKYKDDGKFKYIGSKRKGQKTTYHSSMIWNKKHNIPIDSIDFIFSYLKKAQQCNYNSQKQEKKINVFLIAETFSNSCHVIPEIILMEKGINLRKIGIPIKNRKLLIDKIIEDTTSINIGFLSDEDYEDRLGEKEKNKLECYSFDVPIPYDAYLVNSNWWKNLSSREQTDIKISLSTGQIGTIEKENENYFSKVVYNENIFRLYVGSGILFDSDSTFIIPDQLMDILNFNDSIKINQDLRLYQFSVSDINAIHNTMDTVYLGSARIERKIAPTIYRIKMDSTTSQRIINDSLFLIDKRIHGLLEFQIDSINNKCRCK